MKLLVVATGVVATLHAAFAESDYALTPEQRAWPVPKQDVLKCNPAVHCPDGSIECISTVDLDGKIPDDFDVLQQAPGFCTEIYRPYCKWVKGECKIPNNEAYYVLDDRKAEQRCKRLLLPKDLKSFQSTAPNIFISACRQGKYTCFDGSCAGTQQACINRCRQKRCTVEPVRYDLVRCETDCRNADDNMLGMCPTPVKNETISIVEIPDGTAPPAVNPGEIGEQVCCDLAAQNIEIPGFEIDHDEYTSEACCNPLGNNFLINNHLDEPTGNGKYKIYNVNKRQDKDQVHPVEGVELSVEFHNEVSESECCCKILCTCAGDPHCSAFSGMQAVGLRPDGKLLMMMEGDFELWTYMGANGIIAEVEFKLPDEQCLYSKKASDGEDAELWYEKCNGEPPKEVRGKDVPWALRANLDFDTGYFCNPGQRTKDCTSAGGTIRVGTSNEVTLFLRKFMPFQTGKTIYRFDVEVKRFASSREGDKCCPGPETSLPSIEAALNKAKIPYGGFCYQPVGEESETFFSVDGLIFEDTAVGNRIDINDATAFGTKGGKKKGGKKKKGSKAKIKKGDLEVEEIPECDDYVRAAVEAKGNNVDRVQTLQQCANDFADYGAEGVVALMDSLRTKRCKCVSEADINCKKEGNLFKEELPACASGLTLQARPSGGGQWQFVRSFRANQPYCDNKIFIALDGSVEFGEDDTKLTDDFDLRWIERIDSPSGCNPCRPRELVAKISYKVEFGKKDQFIPAQERKVKCRAPEASGCSTCEYFPGKGK